MASVTLHSVNDYKLGKHKFAKGVATPVDDETLAHLKKHSPHHFDFDDEAPRSKAGRKGKITIETIRPDKSHDEPSVEV